MQKVHNTIKASLICLMLGVAALAGTVTPNLSRNVVSPSFAPRLCDGQETHGGGKGTKTLRLIAGDGQETHGGKGTA